MPQNTASGSMPEIIVISVDYDGCIGPDRGKITLKIAMLMKNMAERLEGNPDAKIIVVNGSYRQDIPNDAFNCRGNNNGSCFIALQKLTTSFQNEYPDFASRIELDTFLLGDILYDTKSGEHFKRALEEFKKDPANYINLDKQVDVQKILNYQAWHTSDKCPQIFAHLQQIATRFPGKKIEFIHVDDSPKIRESLSAFFTSKEHWMIPWIPPNVSVCVRAYVDGELKGCEDDNWHSGTGYTDWDFWENAQQVASRIKNPHGKNEHSISLTIRKIIESGDTRVIEKLSRHKLLSEILEEIIRQSDIATAIQLMIASTIDDNKKAKVSGLIAHHIVKKNSLADLEMLLKNPLDLTVLNEDNCTPILAACKNNRWELIGAFIDSMQEYNEHYDCILFHAARTSEFGIFNRLMQRIPTGTAQLYFQDKMSALTELITHKNYGLIEPVLEKMSLNITENKICCLSAFKKAIQKKDSAAFKILLPYIDDAAAQLQKTVDDNDWDSAEWITTTLFQCDKKLGLAVSIVCLQAIASNQPNLAKQLVLLHMPPEEPLKEVIYNLIAVSADIHVQQRHCSKTTLLLNVLQITREHLSANSWVHQALTRMTTHLSLLPEESASDYFRTTFKVILNSFTRLHANSIDTDDFLDATLITTLSCILDPEVLKPTQERDVETLCKKHYDSYVTSQLVLAANTTPQLDSIEAIVTHVMQQAEAEESTLVEVEAEVKEHVRELTFKKLLMQSEQKTLLKAATQYITLFIKPDSPEITKIAYHALLFVLSQTDLTQPDLVEEAIKRWCATKPAQSPETSFFKLLFEHSALKTSALFSRLPPEDSFKKFADGLRNAIQLQETAQSLPTPS